MKDKTVKAPIETPEDPRVTVTNRVLEILRNIRRRGTPEQAIEAAELEKIVAARVETQLDRAA